MTARQRLVPLGVITVFGIGVTYFLVKPAFDNTRLERNTRAERRREIWQTRYEGPPDVASPTNDSASPPSPETILRKTEEHVANAGGATRIPKDAPRWAEVQEGQFAEFQSTFKWRDVPLDSYSNKSGQTTPKKNPPYSAVVYDPEYIAKKTDPYEQRDIPTERRGGRGGARK